MGEVGDHHRFLPHVDPGVLLTLQLAQLVGDRLATRSGDLLPQPFAVRADAQVDRARAMAPKMAPNEAGKRPNPWSGLLSQSRDQGFLGRGGEI